MLYACVERFDVMGGRGNILGWDGEVNTTQGVKFGDVTSSVTYRCRMWCLDTNKK
jgi:hypothetical protein